MSPEWERSAVVGTRAFVLMMLPVCLLFSWAIPRGGLYGDVGEGLIVLFPVAVVLGLPVGFGNAYFACWLGRANRVSPVYIAIVLAVLADFAVVGLYLSVNVWLRR